MITARRLRTRVDGLAVYGYEHSPGTPLVGCIELADALDVADIPTAAAHAHDFFVIVYFERGGGTLRYGWRDWPVAAGEVYLVAPGDVVGIGADGSGFRAAHGRAVHFSPEVLGAAASGSLLSWRAHPLLFPFADGTAGEPKRWTIAPDERAAWTARLRAIDRELRERRPNHRDAVAAQLVLLLVDIGRLARPGDASTPSAAEPLLADVFEYIDEHYADPASLHDVARAVSLSPGHLTTVVRRKTGRTVQAWITERRHAEARTLLADTELAIDEIGRRVGYPDPSYFARSFRKQHGTTPRHWRRAARAATTTDNRERLPRAPMAVTARSELESLPGG